MPRFCRANRCCHLVVALVHGALQFGGDLVGPVKLAIVREDACRGAGGGGLCGCCCSRLARRHLADISSAAAWAASLATQVVLAGWGGACSSGVCNRDVTRRSRFSILFLLMWTAVVAVLAGRQGAGWLEALGWTCRRFEMAVFFMQLQMVERRQCGAGGVPDGQARLLRRPVRSRWHGVRCYLRWRHRCHVAAAADARDLCDIVRAAVHYVDIALGCSMRGDRAVS